MNKDVIYIDVEDDITAIIGKIKSSEEKIIALVPPKRIGVLQSAINLRLLDRMAKNEKKHLVIITANQALMALAASASIPVAKNLQSKPEIAEIPAIIVDDGDDIIDGSELPIGDHAGSTSEEKEAKASKSSSRQSTAKARPTRGDSLETLAIDGEAVDVGEDVVGTSVPLRAVTKKNKVKIPNYNKFRTRLVIAIIVGVALIAGLIWAFVFAPAATITITASTSPAPVSASVKLGGTAATDAKAGVISSESQQLKKDATLQFDATGTKDAGTQATGTVVFKNCESNAADPVPAGTTISVGGLNYTTNTAVTVPAASGFATCSSAGTSDPVGITSTNPGDSYNQASGTTFSVSGHSGTTGTFYFKAVASTAIAGGTSKTVKVVTDDDIARATGQLVGQSTDALKKQVESQFKNGEVVIDSSFTADQGAAVSAPASGQPADDSGKATLTIPMTYTVYALPKTDLDTYLTGNLTNQITDTANQRVYDNGDSKVALSNFAKAADGTMTVTVTANGQIGPKIDESAVKTEVKGKITGDVQQVLGTINGVQNVDVGYSYFWVRKVPNNTNKITIEFKVQNAS